MKIAVIGAGGVGGYLGGRLAAAGNDVTFVAHSGAHLDAIRERGLTVLSSGGDLHIHPAQVVEHIEQLSQPEIILIAVKCWDAEAVARHLRPFAERGAGILSLQNGVEKDHTLGKHVPVESILGGVCYIASGIEKPGVIRHTGSLQRVLFGEYNGERSPRVEALLRTCQLAAIDAEVVDDVETRIWQKFVFLTAFSGLTSATRQPIGPIRANIQARAVLLDLMQEVVSLGKAMGVKLAADYAEDRLQFSDTLPPAMTSSMHNDLERGTRLELDWLSGWIQERGASIGVATPMNRTIAGVLSVYADGRP